MVAIPTTFQQFNTRINPSTNVGYSNPSQISTKTAPYPNDSFATTSKPKEKSKVFWWVAGAAVLGVFATGALVVRGRLKAVTKLAEHIDFKPAKTIDEAKDFAMKNLGIKKFDVGNDVDIANWVNEGLTQASNRFKGRAYLPENVALFPPKLLKENPNVLAGMNHGFMKRDSKGFMHHTLYINPNSNSVAGMIDEIKKVGLVNVKDKTFTLPMFMRVDDDMRKILVKAANKKPLYVNEIYQLQQFASVCDDFLGSPKVVLKDLYSQKGFVELAKTKAPKVYKKFADLEKLSEKELYSYKDKLFRELLNNGVKRQDIPTSSILTSKVSPFDTIFHELGHTAHEKNAIFKYNNGTFKEGGKLYKMFKTPEMQEVAQKVSVYATKTPYEFVADVFAGLMRGIKYSDDVMALYKKLNGPVVPA